MSKNKHKYFEVITDLVGRKWLVHSKYRASETWRLLLEDIRFLDTRNVDRFEDTERSVFIHVRGGETVVIKYADQIDCLMAVLFPKDVSEGPYR